MPELFDQETKEALRQIFSGFPREVVDYLFIAPPGAKCNTCKDAVELAKALEGVSKGRLKVEIVDTESDLGRKVKPRYAPAWVFDTPGLNVRYYGLPLSQEFPPFVYMHQYIATGSLKLPREIIDEVKSIERELHVKIFVTPECPYCPLVVDTFNQMGIVNDKLLVETIEAIEFPWEADKYRVYYVPAIIISDVERIDGYVPPDILVKVLKRAALKLEGKEIPEELRFELVPAEAEPVEHHHHHEH